jgi:hypothetical protein
MVKHCEELLTRTKNWKPEFSKLRHCGITKFHAECLFRNNTDSFHIQSTLIVAIQEEIGKTGD